MSLVSLRKLFCLVTVSLEEFPIATTASHARSWTLPTDSDFEVLYNEQIWIAGRARAGALYKHRLFSSCYKEPRYSLFRDCWHRVPLPSRAGLSHHLELGRCNAFVYRCLLYLTTLCGVAVCVTASDGRSPRSLLMYDRGQRKTQNAWPRKTCYCR